MLKRLFYGLNFTQARPFYIPSTTFIQALFQPEYDIYLVQALIQTELY